jgi:hypothetical protein
MLPHFFLRRHQRRKIAVRLEVQIRTLGSPQAFVFVTINVSPSGLLVQSRGADPKLEIHAQWEATLYLPKEGGPGRIEIPCIVSPVHKTSEGRYGLKIVNIGASHQTILDTFLEGLALRGLGQNP